MTVESVEDTAMFSNVSAFEDFLDLPALRAGRKNQVVAAMEQADLDVLFLGREANARYVSGAEREWLAATRPFAPTCVLTRAGDVYLMCFHGGRAGIAAELPASNVFANTWNPMTFAATLREMSGVPEARRIGVDGFTPFWFGILATVAPHASFVGAQNLLADVRAVKSPAEVECLRRAAAIAEGALSEAINHLEPGITELALQGRFRWRMAQLGTTQFGQAGTFTTIEDGAPMRWISDDRRIEAGASVAMYGGVQWLGYEGAIGRTRVCGGSSSSHAELTSRWRRTMDAMLAHCRPGTPATALLQAHENSGEPLPPMPVCYSLGLGAERVLAPAEGDPQTLTPGMVLGLRTSIAGPGGGYFGEDMVLITENGHELLTRLGD